MIPLLLIVGLLLVVALPSLAVRWRCLGCHQWIHERTAAGWRLHCRTCGRTSTGLAGVFARPPGQ